MEKFSISWLTNNKYEEKNIQTWEAVVSVLTFAQKDGGTVRMRLIEEVEAGPFELELMVDDNKYLMTMATLDEGRNFLSSYDSTYRGSEMIDILGDDWHRSLICCDFSIVLAAFKEFFETGTVCREILPRKY